MEGLEAGSLTHLLLLPMGGRRVEPERWMGLYFKASGRVPLPSIMSKDHKSRLSQKIILKLSMGASDAFAPTTSASASVYRAPAHSDA